MKIGKVSENILKRSVLRQLKTKRKEIVNSAGIGEDCAIFMLSEDEVLVSCMQEAAVVLQTEENLAKTDKMTIHHLIQKTANNLAVRGANPFAVMITLLLPEKCKESFLKNIMCEAEISCKKLTMQLAGGQTKVSSAVQEPFAVVTGYGKTLQSGKELENDKYPQSEKYYSPKAVKSGQDIVVSKWIGLEGSAVLARYLKEKLLQRYPAYLVEKMIELEQFYSIVPEAEIAVNFGVCAMHDASEGGIFGALWELCEGADVGLHIDLKKIPLKQETVEVCEYCGVNPYELLSGGCLIMTTENGIGLVEELQKNDIFAAVIGKITDTNDRIISNGEEIRYMDRPKADEIYEIQ